MTQEEIENLAMRVADAVYIATKRRLNNDQYIHLDQDTADAVNKLRGSISRIMTGSIKPKNSIEKDAFERGYVSKTHMMRASHLPKDRLDLALGHMQDIGELVAVAPWAKSGSMFQVVIASRAEE